MTVFVGTENTAPKRRHRKGLAPNRRGTEKAAPKRRHRKDGTEKAAPKRRRPGGRGGGQIPKILEIRGNH